MDRIFSASPLTSGWNWRCCATTFLKCIYFIFFPPFLWIVSTISLSSEKILLYVCNILVCQGKVLKILKSKSHLFQDWAQVFKSWVVCPRSHSYPLAVYYIGGRKGGNTHVNPKICESGMGKDKMKHFGSEYLKQEQCLSALQSVLGDS